MTPSPSRASSAQVSFYLTKLRARPTVGRGARPLSAFHIASAQRMGPSSFESAARREAGPGPFALDGLLADV